jgi:hypothetical protein
VNPTVIDICTRWVFIGPLLLWLPWEVLVLVLRMRGVHVRTLSMVAQDLGFTGLTSVVYFYVGLCSHFWLNRWKLELLPEWCGVFFWVIGFAYLALDAFTTSDHSRWPAWLEVMRWPPVVFGLATASGYLLFWQKGKWLP